MNAVLDTFVNYFDPSHFTYTLSSGFRLPMARRVATMAISDANKRLMLQCDGLIDTLLNCFLLETGNKRRTQDGGDALQEAAAGTLHELSLFGPWASALRSHTCYPMIAS